MNVVSLSHVISLLPESVYPASHDTDNVLPYSTGNTTFVSNTMLGRSGSAVHVSEIIGCIVKIKTQLCADNYFIYCLQTVYYTTSRRFMGAFNKVFIGTWQLISHN